MRFQRCRELFGEDGFRRVKDIKVIILGVGGVGSYLLDCLYRSGVSDITIVDYDKFDETNRNRQIGSDRVGEFKVDIFKELYPSIKTINRRVDIEWVDSFDFEPFNFVIDSLDTTAVKIEIAKRTYSKLIMSAGSANRVDSSKIEVASIWKTHGNRLARKIRSELRKVGFNKNFKVVFSSEPDISSKGGSFVGVTGAFGLVICSEVIKDILS
ncbi:MAG: tRNA threonylcarbamoyladenosine dehydratase [Epsilonproteobacteria bacterium]|nr:tRNA threonylcarbamoyladenosine dehydratase [Campylobacterota bacterium]